MRESGILMHITSLPGPYGVGTMGKQAYHFVDFLSKAGQSVWQILPLNPTGFGDSPYQSFSTFAGNPYLIDLDTLVEEGLLEEQEPKAVNWGSDPGRVSFGKLYEERGKLLRLAYSRFTPDDAYQAFLEENTQWLPDYALFMALKEENGGAPWLEWPEGLRLREEAALAQAREAHTEEMVAEVVRVNHLVLRLREVRAKMPVPKQVHCTTVAVMAEVPLEGTMAEAAEAAADSVRKEAKEVQVRRSQTDPVAEAAEAAEELPEGLVETEQVQTRWQHQVKDMELVAEGENPIQMQIWEEAAEDMGPHRSQTVRPVPKAVS